METLSQKSGRFNSAHYKQSVDTEIVPVFLKDSHPHVYLANIQHREQNISALASNAALFPAQKL